MTQRLQETTRSSTEEGHQAGELVEHLFRRRYGEMVAILTGIFGPENLQMTEDMVQDTLEQALRIWPLKGIPGNPHAWLMRVARNKAIDSRRRDARLRKIVERERDELNDKTRDPNFPEFEDSLGESQVRLIFLCCHPLLSRKAQIALALKTVAGFGVSEIARAFLASESAIAQRLVRAKRRIREAGLNFEIPDEEELPERLEAVLSVLYLLFSEGYSASSGGELVRRHLCEEAIRFATLVNSHPVGDTGSVSALLALMHFQNSRSSARLDTEGKLLLLSDQNRDDWDRDAIAQGLVYLERASLGEGISEYHLLAGVASCHALAESYKKTDWKSILYYYDQLVALYSSPVTRLNRVVALAMVEGPDRGLAELEGIRSDPALKDYYLLPAVEGELCRRSGRVREAISALKAALKVVRNEVERSFLMSRLNELENPGNRGPRNRKMNMSQIEDIEVTFRYEHPRQRVFEKWVSEDTVIPPVTRSKIDLRVGGKIRLFVEMEGETSLMTGEFKTVDEPNQLEYSWEWDENGEVTSVSVTFKDVDGGSEVEVLHSGFTSSESRATHAYGWDAYLSQLREKLK